MPSPRLILFVVAVLVATVGGIATVLAQSSPEPAKASPAVVKSAPMADIVFYLARGDADACGRGCNEWIVAEGKIDPGAAQRFRRLLAKLGHRRLPVFFHSPGGSVTGSIELGRLIHDQKLEVSVAHTISLGCDLDKPLEKPCEALKRSGQELLSEFDPTLAMCNSACVYALAGGTVRSVPPGVKLGIHDIGLDSGKTTPRGALAEAKRVVHARILEYGRDMGIDKALLTASFAVPNESVRFLERDELVRFGIDRREFGETVWHFRNKPTIAIQKRFFVHTDGGEQPRYLNGFVSLQCGGEQEIRLAFAQERDSSEQKSADPLPVRINFSGQGIVLRNQVPSRQFDMHWISLSPDMFDFFGRGADIKVSGIDRGRNDGSPGSVTLNMDGFSDASVKLRKSCAESARNANAVAPPIRPVAASSNLGAQSPQVQNQPAPRSPAVSQNAPPVPIPPRTPQTVELTQVVAAERKHRLEFLYSVYPDCSSTGQTTARILEQPQHGTLTIENGQGFTNFSKSNQRYECNSRQSNGMLVFYQPSSGYIRTDSITLSVIFPLGTPSTRHYSIEVR
jgi:hypothetical protein